MSEKEALHQIVDFLVSNIKDLNDKVTVLQEALTKVETEVAESARTYFVTVQQRGTEVENEDVTVPLLEFPRSDARSIAMTKNGTPLKVVGDKVPALVGEGSYLRVIDVHPDDGSQTEMFLSAENVHPGSYRSHP